jgi:phospholipid/cholesterol/gamma-HCH transport system permease protein
MAIAETISAQPESDADFHVEPGERTLVCSGAWTIRRLAAIESRLTTLALATGSWELRTDAVQALDSAGALLLERTLRRSADRGVDISLDNLPARHRALLELVRTESERHTAAGASFLNPVERLGKATLSALEQSCSLLTFVGSSAIESVPLVLRPHRIRWRQVMIELRRAGVMALPIIGLLIFLVGVVIAYQGGIPLQRYGANIFIVELVSMTMLREMAPLLTAIIVAGRTGSSYTAEIGTMQVTEEVDALRTMGITPFEMLVLPKLIALIIAMPLLTVFADIMGLLGGMLAADSLLDVSMSTFIDRMPRRLPTSTFWVGIVKTPVFAVIIVLVGCFQGFRVHGSAERVGQATTASVVLSIFLVIVADAIFSIVFNVLNL